MSGFRRLVKYCVGHLGSKDLAFFALALVSGSDNSRAIKGQLQNDKGRHEFLCVHEGL